MALTNYQLVSITYETADGKITDRIIEPFALYHSIEEDWTLVAYCRLRKDYRSFRLDRMKKVAILDQQFEPHKMTMKQYIEKYVSPRINP
jgi:predicted DNA-binding transcriptional regulator YafY